MSTLLTPDIGKNFVAKLLCRLRFKVFNFSLEKLQIFLHPCRRDHWKCKQHPNEAFENHMIYVYD